MARGSSRRLGWLALAAGLAGCATVEPQSIVALPPPPVVAPSSVRLAWLPFETRASAELSGVVNDRLARIVVDGVTETFQAPVSMEMAQLAIECIERTPACYGAVGQSVGADRLLWAELEKGTHGAITLRVSLFDVGGGAVLQKTARTFPNTKAARAGVGTFVDGAFKVRGAGAEASP